ALAPRPGEAAAGPRHRALLVGHGAHLERDAARDEPVVVLDAALAEAADLLLVGARAAGGDQVLRHLLRVVLEAAGLLQRRAAAEVDLPGRLRRRAAAAPAALEREH